MCALCEKGIYTKFLALYSGVHVGRLVFCFCSRNILKDLGKYLEVEVFPIYIKSSRLKVLNSICLCLFKCSFNNFEWFSFKNPLKSEKALSDLLCGFVTYPNVS